MATHHDGVGYGNVDHPSIGWAQMPMANQTKLRPFQKEYTEEGVNLYQAGVIDDPGAVDANRKPIYQNYVMDVSESRSATSVNEKPMSDVESYHWRKFQLFRSLMKIERRDTVHEALSSSDYWGGRATHHWLGTPFPIIEPNPFIGEAIGAIRWYEHAFAFGMGIFNHQRACASPTIRYSAEGVTKIHLCATIMILETCFIYRSIWRLTGQSPNEPECYKYGVYETPARLQQKAERWRKFANYKEEWMRRWNYYHWGMRPGEDFSMNSCCYFPHWKVRYNTKTDFPVRKNPYKVSMRSMRDMMMMKEKEGDYAKGVDSYLTRCRPEFKHHWDGGIG